VFFTFSKFLWLASLFIIQRFTDADYLFFSMYFFDDKVHHLPHIHVTFNDCEAVYGIPHGNKIGGEMPGRKERLIVKWIGLSKHELMENWSRAIAGLPLKFIEPLK